ncbi:MAG: FeoB small GTPase domain-containing protein, partial [Phycisphaerae bacterium]
GNWPGKTVSRAEGAFSYDHKRYKLVDLPGTYSLMSTSTDEEIARDFILFGRPDVTVILTDAARLERNLNLVLQILQITDRAVVCLNLIDEARRHGLQVHDRALQQELGVPVVPTAARQGQGMDLLVQRISEVATGQIDCRPRRVQLHSARLTRTVDELTSKIESAFPALPNARWVAMRLLAGDRRIAEAVRSGELSRLAQLATGRAASPGATR